MATRVFIGLGANLKNPKANLKAAIDALQELPGIKGLVVSSLYQTAPVGPQDQPEYCNAVAYADFDGEPLQLLAALQDIEKNRGRVRDGTRWGPRTLDLDVLLFGDKILDEPDLKVPHPEMYHRAFVLVPLAEIAPGLQLPVWGKNADGLLAEMTEQELAEQKVEKKTWD